MGAIEKNQTFLLKFKNDTVTTVSRKTVDALSDVLGMDVTQTVHIALACLRDDLLKNSVARTNSPPGGPEDYPPMTATQLIGIREMARKPKGKLISDEFLF
jgi:hypothetical protein